MYIYVYIYICIYIYIYIDMRTYIRNNKYNCMYMYRTYVYEACLFEHTNRKRQMFVLKSNNFAS